MILIGPGGLLVWPAGGIPQPDGLLTPSTGVTLVNAALASNGATATASSTLNTSYPASAAINGDRTGAGWGAGTGGWNDNTPGVWPDFLWVNFSGTYSISRIDVVSLQDNYTSPVEPTPSLTWSLYGVSAFYAEYWTGSAWATIPGSTVTGNNLVWRSVTFDPVTTSAVRLWVTASSGTGYSRVVEFEAWGEAVAGSNTSVGPAALSHGHTLGSPTVSTGLTLPPASASHGHTLGSPTLSTQRTIAPASSSHGHTLGSPALTTAQTIAPAASSHGHTLGSPTLTASGAASLAPAAASHGHTLGSPSLSTARTIAADAMSHGHTLAQGTVSTSGAANVAPAGMAHSHSLSSPALNTGTQIVVGGLLHGHTVSAPTITALSGSVLSPGSMTHAHALGSPALSAFVTLSPSAILHAHALTNGVLGTSAVTDSVSRSSGQVFYVMPHTVRWTIPKHESMPRKSLV